MADQTQIELYRRQAEEIAQRFHERFVSKYVEGGVRHGGDLMSVDTAKRDMLIEAENEVLDQWAYLQALRRERERLRAAVNYEVKWREDVERERESLRQQLAEAVARNRALIEKYEGV